MTKITLNTIYQWPPKKQLLIFGVVFCVVFLAGYIWDITNIKGKIIAAQDQEVDLKQQIDMAISKEGTLVAELKQSEVSHDLLTKWQGKLITHAQLPELQKEILKIGAINNIEFSLFNPESETPDGIYMKLPIDMVMVASYHQTADFVSQLANTNNIIVIKNFIISNENKADELGSKLADKANSVHLLTVKMQLEIYFVPEKVEAVDAK